MSNKLVYIAGVPYWMTPEGGFEAASSPWSSRTDSPSST